MAENVQEQMGGNPIFPNAPSFPGGVGPAPGGAPQQPQQPIINPGNPQQGNCGTQGQTNAPSFIEIARQTVVATAMSQKGTQYIKELKETISERATGAVVKPEVITLAYPPETICVHAGNNAILLLFSEANRREENLPVVALERLALQAMQALLGKTVRMWNVIVVTPEDYDKASVMGACLVNTLVALSAPEVQGMSINSMSSYQIEISTNPVAYDNFIARFNPHGIQDRADLKLTVSLNLPRRNNGNMTNLFDQASSEKIDIGTIGAYVIFTESTQAQMGIKKFIPEVHISNLCPMVQFDGLIPLLLAIATETLIDNAYWKTQFADLGPNSPNIGNLVDDTNTGQPFRCENLAQRDNLINAWCDHPVLILDVMEGRYRIPGIERYALPGMASAIIGTYNRFLGVNAVPDTSNPAYLYANDYTGYIKVGHQISDSRWCSYLNMMIHNATRKAACAMLLAHYQREEDNVNAVRQFFPDLDLLYVNHMVLLEPSVLRSVQASVKQHIRTINGNAVSGVVDTSVLLTAGKGFISSPTGVYYGTQVNPWTQIYGTGGMQPTLFS